MWGRLSVICALVSVAVGAPLSSTPCPESCECSQLASGHLETRCTTLNFLEKLQPKQVNAIVSLDLSGVNLTHLHSKLKKLRNLKRVILSNNNLNDVSEVGSLAKLTYLNLKGNHIKYFNVRGLSGHLKYFDISNNYLTYIPKELTHLPGLKEVNLYNNPISCTCDTLKDRDLLLSAGVVLVKPVTCHSPEKLRGQLLQTVNCTKYNDDLLDHPQGDYPTDEGSGDGDDDATFITNTSDVFDDGDKGDLTALEDEQFIHESPSVPPSSSAPQEDEGSGDDPALATAEDDDDDYEEGSGYDELAPSTVAPIYVRPKACNFDCSTENPYEIDVNATGPDPDVLHEISKDIKEIIYPFEDESTSSSSTTTEEPDFDEDVIGRIDVEKVGAGPSETLGEREKVQEADEIKDTPATVNTNLIIVIALVAIMLCLVCVSIAKKRKARKKRPEVAEQEMKQLNSKPNSSIPEKTPLMNGQNGNINGKPVEEPVEHRRNEELDSRSPHEDDEVDLRKPNRDEDSLLPETHRVTIQVKELNTPKTPLLVTRLRSDDGQFITTPSLDRL